MAERGYRPDIDGLRTVAIVPVVLFHAGLAGFGGGFAGVDVFFVISGFLITGILHKELSATGSINILSFYARRIARIFPALLVVSVETLAFGAVLLSSALYEVQALAKSVIASLAFLANFYFLGVTSDYFAADSQSFPFLHMWSLAVEEQYYLVWPVVMIAAARIASRLGRLRAHLLCAIIPISIMSLLLCAYLGAAHPAQAFYLPFTRAWELGLGSALALFPAGAGRTAAGRVLTSLAAPCGLLLVLAGFAIIREGPGFPFPLSLLTVGGTALMIWGGGVAPGGAVSRMLGTAPFVSIGRVSYAWYLWHWPLLSFAHILTLGEAGPVLRYGLVIASLCLAYATMYAVEIPFRFGVARRARPIIIVGGGLTASALVAGLACGIYLASRLNLLGGDPRIAAAATDLPARQTACLAAQDGGSGASLPRACLVDGDGPRIVLWGDSHASQWSPAIDVWAQRHPGWGVEQLTLEACPPLPGAMPTDIQADPFQPFVQCNAFNAAVWDRLQDATPPRRIVVLGANWRFRAAIPYADKKGRGTRIESFDVGARDTASSVRVMATRLDMLLTAFGRARTPVIIALQSPEMKLPPAACVQRLGAARCAVSEATFANDASVVNRVIRQVASRHDHVAVLNPEDILCGDGTCPAEIEGRVAYHDVGHVAASTARSRRSLARWLPALDQAAGWAIASPTRK